MFSGRFSVAKGDFDRTYKSWVSTESRITVRGSSIAMTSSEERTSAEARASTLPPREREREHHGGVVGVPHPPAPSSVLGAGSRLLRDNAVMCRPIRGLSLAEDSPTSFKKWVNARSDWLILMASAFCLPSVVPLKAVAASIQRARQHK